MNTFPVALRRECRVAFSRRAQPVWFRIAKWIVYLSMAATLHGTGWFWWWIGGLPALGFSLHIVYRWKTKAWTRAWGGWNDLEAGRH